MSLQGHRTEWIAQVLKFCVLLFAALGAQTQPAPVMIDLAAATVPAIGQPGVTLLTLTCSGLPPGTITPKSLTVTLQVGVGIIEPSLTANVIAFSPLPTRAENSTRLQGAGPDVTRRQRRPRTRAGRITFQVTGPNVAFPTQYLVFVSGTTSTGVTFASGQPASVTINPSARILSLSSYSGFPGDSIQVTISGQYTNYVQGVTRANFGSGISVGGATVGESGLVTVTSATTATALIVIDPAAAPGPRTVTVTTGAQQASLAGGFIVPAPTVQPATPVITQVSPSTGQQGQQNLSVTLTGRATHFESGISTANFGPGVTVVSLIVDSPTSAIATLDIDPAATSGARSMTLTTGTEVVTLANGFTVQPGTPALLSVLPNIGPQGQQNIVVTITGKFTHFRQGASQVSFGSDITVSGVAVSSATSLTATINIPVSATQRAHTITVTTGDEVVSLANSYTVQMVVLFTSPANLSYLNITPTTVNGTVSDTTATVTVNSIPAPVSNGTFSIQLPLVEGPNIVTATAINAAGQVATASIQVNLDTTPPHVTITSPPDQFTTSVSSITVSGIVNDIVVGTVNAQQAQVTVNGTPASVANRTFLATNIPLNVGPNTIQAVARDQSGNPATTQITVTRQAPTAQPQIQLISGNNQTGMIGSALATPLAVGLIDASGKPAPNTPVIFKVTQNNGMVATTGAPASSVVATTNALGQAQVQWTLGMHAGAGSDGLEAYAVGFSGTAIFTASSTLGPAGKIVIDTGNNQIGPTNQALPKPLIAVVVDPGNNRLPNVPVTFTVQQGGGTLAVPTGTSYTLNQTGPTGITSVTLNTDSDGRAGVTLVLGTQEGNANNLVTADFPNDQGFPASFTASSRAEGPAANTLISGVVLDNSNRPLPGVTIRAVLTNLLNSNSSVINVAATVRTNAQGQFSILQAPVGFVKLLVDGSTASKPGSYPTLDYDLVTIAGHNNTLATPVYLLPLNSANQLCVTGTTGGGTLTIPEAPGFSLTFGPGQVTFPGGSQSGCVNVTVVHPDRVPMSPGFGQQPRFIVTIQPAGAIFNPPAPISLPNVDGLKPREITEMYSFDHDIGSFVAIGTGTVTDDGQVIRSNPGVGVLKAGWHCGGNPQQTGGAGSCGPCATCNGTSCVANSTQGGTCQNQCLMGGAGTCNNGYCTGTPQPPGYPCGVGGACDGMGNCGFPCVGPNCTCTGPNCGGGCGNCNSGDPCIDDSCVSSQCVQTPNQLCQNACMGRTSGSCTVTNSAGVALNGTCDGNGNCNLCSSLGSGASCTCGGGGVGTCNAAGQCVANGQVCSGLTIHLTWRGQMDPQVIYIRQGNSYSTQGLLSATVNSVGGTFTWTPIINSILDVTGSGSQVNLTGTTVGSSDLVVSYIDPNGQMASVTVLVNVIYPVILVHGINSDAGTWSDLIASLTARDYLVQDGGVNYCNGPSADYDFCAVNFATDQRTQPWGSQSDFETEGNALTGIIAYVQSVTGASKVTIVAHSMGGLASRWAVETGAANSVYKLITIGTPHVGSTWANLITSGAGDVGIVPGIGAFLVGLKPASPGVQSLEPTSPELSALNSSVSSMAGVKNVSIIGRAAAVLSAADVGIWDGYVAANCTPPVTLLGTCPELTSTRPAIDEILTNGDLIVASTAQDLNSLNVFSTPYQITATHLGETSNAAAISDVLLEIIK